MNIKKIRVITFSFFVIIFLFSGFSYCSAAWNLNAVYFPIPGAPAISSSSTLPDYIVYLFFAGIYLAGALAVVSIVIGGVRFIISAQNPSQAGAAREQIFGSIWGLILLSIAVLVLTTINPKLTELKVSVDLQPSLGPVLKGGQNSMSAPNQVTDMKQLGDYNTLSWPKTLQNISDNCNKNIYGYIIYIYKKTDLTDLISSQELKCGGGDISLNGGLSYVMQAETPGVYLFDTSNGNFCSPTLGTNEMPPSPLSSSNPNFSLQTNQSIGCISIINGPDKNTGPFYGIVGFDQNNYYGANWFHFSPAEKADTKSVFTGDIFNGKNHGHSGSFIIYQKAGKDTNGNFINAGAGVALYSLPNRDSNGGLYCPEDLNNCIISNKYMVDDNGGNHLNIDLTKANITYLQGSDESIALEKKCQKFVTLNQNSQDVNKYCFRSMNIDGTYLVLLSADQDTAFTNSNSGSHTTPAQAFPKSNSENDKYGPPELGSEAIKLSNIRYIEIIPLASPLF